MTHSRQEARPSTRVYGTYQDTPLAQQETEASMFAVVPPTKLESNKLGLPTLKNVGVMDEQLYPRQLDEVPEIDHQRPLPRLPDLRSR